MEISSATFPSSTGENVSSIPTLNTSTHMSNETTEDDWITFLLNDLRRDPVINELDLPFPRNVTILVSI